MTKSWSISNRLGVLFYIFKHISELQAQGVHNRDLRLRLPHFENGDNLNFHHLVSVFAQDLVCLLINSELVLLSGSLSPIHPNSLLVSFLDQEFGHLYLELLEVLPRFHGLILFVVEQSIVVHTYGDQREVEKENESNQADEPEP